MPKPGIIVLSPDDDTEFRYMTDGWNDLKHVNTLEAKALMVKVHREVEAGVFLILLSG